MNTNFMEKECLETMSTTWDQYERFRLQRLREQKERMEKMRVVVEEYTRIIDELETKNRILSLENEQLRATGSKGSDILSTQYKRLQHQYAIMCNQLKKQRSLRINCQNLLESLRKQLASTQASGNYAVNLKQQYRTSLETDYQILLRMHQEIKEELYALQKQNTSLKQVIRGQSKMCYEKDLFWKENSRPIKDNLRREQKENRAGVIRTSSKVNIREPCEEQTTKKANSTTNSEPQIKQKEKDDDKSNLSITRSRKRDLENQIRKQAELIQKYKQTEDQQNKLIDILKSQNSKVCLCHRKGSSNKIVSSKGSKGLVSFKNTSESQAQN